MKLYPAIYLVAGLAFANAGLSDTGIWVPWGSHLRGYPSYAVIADYVNGSPVLVIRANHGNAGSIVGKYNIDENYAHIPYGNREHQKTSFQVLTHSNARWINAPGGTLIPGGNGQYICRVYFNGHYENGKLHRGACFISYAGDEIQNNDWETLKIG